MSGCCQLSIFVFEDFFKLLCSSCITRQSSGGRQACKNQDVSMMLQAKNLHTRKGTVVPIPCFSAYFAIAVQGASWCGADEFGQSLIAEWEASKGCGFSMHSANNLLMISSTWYDSHNLHHDLLLLRTQQINFKGNKIHVLCSYTTHGIHGRKRPSICLYACKTISSGNAFEVLDDFLMSSIGTMFYLSDDHFVQDSVLSSFGLCHQRWTTISLLLIPRFNGEDPLRLSFVMVLKNLQLSPPKPRVHTPDRPSEEPPAGHQPVCSTMEALKDCRCSNIESGLSTDE